MDEKFQKLKRITGFVIKQMARPFVIVTVIVCIVLVLIAGMQYVVTLDDAVKKSGDKKNVPYAVEEHTGNVNIDNEGNITVGKTAKELWDEMLENGSRINEYLDRPEELLKMMNAEMVTNYLDTRPNPDEPIDWKKINKDINSNKVQGIIKMKRAYDDGTISNITYVDPTTFQMYITNYNQTGSEEDKKKALSHFTLEKGYKGSSSFGTGQSITTGTVINIPAGLGSVHTYMGWQMITATTSMQYKLREQAGMNFDENGFGRINGRYVIACTSTFGNVGDYVDFYKENGTIIQGIIGDIKNQNDVGCNEWGHDNGDCVVEFVVDKDTWYNGGRNNPNRAGDPTQLYHTEWNGSNVIKAINGGSYFDNPNFGSSNIQGNDSTTNSPGGSTISGDLMKWPTDGTNITSYFGLRDAPTAGASTNHGAIDIGVPTGTNVYATEAGTVTMAGWSDSGGNMVTIDHGNGYESKYLHNSSLQVAVGQTVTKGQVIALAGSTGVSTGPHVHFQIEYNGEAVDPLTFKYDNGMGDGSGGIGSNAGTLSTNNTLYAKVATWNEVTDTVVSNDPAVENYSTTRYSMTTTKVDYQALVEKYEMPFDYLWALLVVGQEKDFIMDLADLVMDSKIEITVHDNLTTNTNVAVDTYTNKTKVITDEVEVKVNYTDTITSTIPSSAAASGVQTITSTKPGSETRKGGPFEAESEISYTTTHTVVTKTNTLDIKVTKADVWIVDYSQAFTYQIPAPVVTTSSIPYADEEYPAIPDKSDSNDSMGLGEKYRQSVEAECEAIHTTASATIKNLISHYFYKTVDRNVNITNTLESKKYVASPANIIEKTDKQSTKPNFVTLFLKHRKFENNIRSAPDWLFEILAQGDLVNKVDLTKYLLYKATGRDYGKTEYDFSIFNVENFNPIVIGGGGGGAFTGDSITLGTYTFPHYLQRDYPGAYGTSTIPAAGCGPTSLAMILAGIKNDTSINPHTVVANINDHWPDGSYYVPGVGSSHCIFWSEFLQKYYGVTSEMYPSASTALEALEKGYPVIGGETGHILAIVPVSPELKAQGYKFYILDSGRGHDGPYRSIEEANAVVEGNLSFTAIIKP